MESSDPTLREPFRPKPLPAQADPGENVSMTQIRAYRPRSELSAPPEIIERPDLPLPADNHFPEGKANLIILLNEAGEVDEILTNGSTLEPDYLQQIIVAFARAKYSAGYLARTPVKSRITIEITTEPATASETP